MPREFPSKAELERESRQKVIALCRAMLAGELSFFEGAHEVARRRFELGSLAPDDIDLLSFVLIESETDHLPLPQVRSYWAPEVLSELEPDFSRIEEWAKNFAPAACESLIGKLEVFC